MKCRDFSGKTAFVTFLIQFKNKELFGGVESDLQVWLIVGLLLSLFAPPIVQGTESRKRELVVGVRIDAPPFSACKGELKLAENDSKKYVCSSPDTEDKGDKYWGYTVDLCKRIIHRAVVREGLYCSVGYREVSSKDRFELLKDKKIDLLCGASTVTLERMRISDFTLFTFLSGASVIYGQPSSEGDNDNTKDNFTVGVLENTTSKEQVDRITTIFLENQEDFREMKLRRVKTISFSNHYEGILALRNRKIDAYIADKEILLALIADKETLLALEKLIESTHQSDDPPKESAPKSSDPPQEFTQLKVLQDYFTVEPYAIGISLGNPDLRFVANTVLSELFSMDQEKEDSISAILQKNFPGKTFSKSLEHMFRLQQLKVGTRVANDFLSRIYRHECNDKLKGQSDE
jgi:ABC-type amino acid transport substrate-binding protein